MFRSYDYPLSEYAITKKPDLSISFSSCSLLAFEVKHLHLLPYRPTCWCFYGGCCSCRFFLSRQLSHENMKSLFCVHSTLINCTNNRTRHIYIVRSILSSFAWFPRVVRLGSTVEGSFVTLDAGSFQSDLLLLLPSSNGDGLFINWMFIMLSYIVT